MASDVLRALRKTSALGVVGRRHQQATVRRKLALRDPQVWQPPHVDQDIPDLIAHCAHGIFAEAEHRAQLRVLGAEARENRRDAQPPEAERCNDMKRPLDPTRPGSHVLRKAFDFAQNALRPTHEISPFGRKPEVSPTALDKPQMQAIFQQCQPLRHRRGRDAQIARRRRKARCCGKGREKAEIGDIKH